MGGVEVDHLTQDQIAELAEELDRVVKKLERSMRTTEEAMRPVKLDQTAVGRLSRIDSLQNQGLTRNLQPLLSTGPSLPGVQDPRVGRPVVSLGCT